MSPGQRLRTQPLMHGLTMADPKSLLTAASDALWASVSAVLATFATGEVDTAQSDISLNYLIAVRGLAVYVAEADGHLSHGERAAIDDIFWLAPKKISTWAMRDSPDLVAASLRALSSSARALADQSEQPFQADPDHNLVYLAVERVLQTVLAVDGSEEPEVMRLNEVTSQLRGAILKEAEPATLATTGAAAIDLEPTSTTGAQRDDQTAIGGGIAADLAALNRLVGLAGVKQQVETLVNLAKVFALRRQMGLSVPPMSFHLVFTGNPGTGKTTVARIVAQLYGKLGLLSKGQLVEVDRSGLIANYVGQTATKVEGVIAEARGGVLFIDEAYALDTGDENDFGHEAVTTLIKGMEDHRVDLVVIAAGYTEQMHRFLDMNPGLRSRMSRDVAFDDYSPAEMAQIFRNMAADADYVLPHASSDLLVAAFEQMWIGRDAAFANARDVRNLFERVIEAQANRIGTLASASAIDLQTITLEGAVSLTRTALHRMQLGL